MGSDLGRYELDPNREALEYVHPEVGGVLLEIIDRMVLNDGQETSPMSFSVSVAELGRHMPAGVNESVTLLLKGLVELLQGGVLEPDPERYDQYRLDVAGLLRYRRIRGRK